MGLMKLAVPALALASGVLAQNSSPCSGTKTIQNAGDAQALSACSTVSGSVHFATQVAGAVTLDGVKKITGDLLIMGASNLTSLEADSLSTVGGTFELQGLTQLSTLTMPALESAQTITWQTLPALQGATFTKGISQVSSLDIQDTNLQNLNGFNLTSADTINLANNNYLTQLSFPITQITNSLTINANGQGSLNAAFPNLTSADSIRISNCSSLDISSLQNTTSGLVLSGNNFPNITANSLTSTLGLALYNNNKMKSMSFSGLQTCSGALRVENNTAFTGTISFPALTKISGAARFFGDFTGLSLPQLNTAVGLVTIYSTADIQSVCTKFSNLYGGNGPLRVSPVCTSGQSTSSTTGGSSPTSVGSSASQTTTHKSAANAVYPTASVLGLSGALAALFGLLM